MSDNSQLARQGKIQSLVRATAILETVASHVDGINLAQLSKLVGLNNSTVFHLVKTLVDLGYLNRDPVSKYYRIGTRLFMLAASAVRESTLLSLGSPLIDRLSNETGQAAHLAVRSNQNIAIIARSAAAGMLQLSDDVASHRPPHATAIGKILLAAMQERDMEELLTNMTLERFTENTIVSRSALLQEIQQVHSNGIAFDNSELDPDVRCLAIPVYDFAGRCVAAMGLSGPVWRLNDEMMDKLIGPLRLYSNELSKQLGFRPVSTEPEISNQRRA